MYNSIRSLLLNSILVSVVLTPICQGNNAYACYDSYNNSVCDSYQSTLEYQLDLFDREVAALHVFKNELIGKGETELLYWLDNILKQVYYVDYGYSKSHAYCAGDFLQNILNKMRTADDKVACLKGIKLQLDLKELEDEIKHQKHQIKRLKRQANTSVLDRVKRTLNDYAPEIFIGTMYAAVGMAMIHCDQIRPIVLGLRDKAAEVCSLASAKSWDIAKGLCPYAPTI